MMSPDSIIFAGLEVSSGRKPVTFAALDDDLNVTAIEHWDVAECLTCLKDYANIWLAINLPSLERQSDKELQSKILQAGFSMYPRQAAPKQLLVTTAQDCFHALIARKAFARRTLEGRLQRSAVLYEQGLQIKDPVDVFEEITRYKLMQGILPLESIHSPKELDALVAAYVAWLAANRPGRITSKGEFVLPVPE